MNSDLRNRRGKEVPIDHRDIACAGESSVSRFPWRGRERTEHKNFTLRISIERRGFGNSLAQATLSVGEIRPQISLPSPHSSSSTLFSSCSLFDSPRRSPSVSPNCAASLGFDSGLHSTGRRRICIAMVQQAAQGAPVIYAKEMERLSAKESLLLPVSIGV
ncbi:uncharacterized protein LOC111470266 [Cucurbita maxima]|uniref:Uncharacterized protein LOC111470266 n=1 Tax=Cucurbita maxima TaxID=3661 RepID=A0A6J1I3P6_CUCMA|nr:uncharacterized protein LOC111470266 [Cucurbita maxima]